MREKTVDVLLDGIAADKGHPDGERRIHETRAQLDQMLDERHLALLEIFVLAHDARSDLAGAGCCGASMAGKACGPVTGACVAPASASAGGGLLLAILSKSGTSGAFSDSAISPFGSIDCSTSLVTSIEATLSTCFLTSSSSDSRIICSTLLWNSREMTRALRTQTPAVRRALGSSFGPITTMATTPISAISLQLKSNMTRHQS